MSATKSASTGMPYLNPKLTTLILRRVASGVPNASATRSGELVDVEVAGVDDQVGVAAQPFEHLALALQAVDQPAAALERVRAPRGVLAADEHVVGGLEEEQRRTPAGARPVARVAWRESKNDAGAYVDHDRDGLLHAAALRRPGVTDVGQQAGRQVVDDVEAEVLQLLRRGAATRRRSCR